MSTFLKKHKLALIVILIVLVIGIAGAAVFTAQQSAREAERVAWRVTFNSWTQSSTSLRKGLHMHLEVDQRGNDIPVCDVDAIDPALLENLATAYNASPWSEGFEPYTSEELKRELGDELVSILGAKDSRDSRLFSFLTWCDVPADLYYSGFIIGDDGKPLIGDDGEALLDPVHKAGADASDTTYNYQHIANKLQGSDLDRFYAWELPLEGSAQ